MAGAEGVSPHCVQERGDTQWPRSVESTMVICSRTKLVHGSLPYELTILNAMVSGNELQAIAVPEDTYRAKADSRNNIVDKDMLRLS